MKKIASNASKDGQGKNIKSKLSKVAKSPGKNPKKIPKLALKSIASGGDAVEPVNGGNKPKILFKPKKGWNVLNGIANTKQEEVMSNKGKQSTPSSGPTSPKISRMLKKKMKLNASSSPKPEIAVKMDSSNLSRKLKRKLKVSQATGEAPIVKTVAKSRKLMKFLKINQVKSKDTQDMPQSPNANSLPKSSKRQKSKSKMLLKLGKIKQTFIPDQDLSVVKSAKENSGELPATNMTNFVSTSSKVSPSKKKIKKQKKLQKIGSPDGGSGSHKDLAILNPKRKAMKKNSISASGETSVPHSDEGAKKMSKKALQNTESLEKASAKTESNLLTKGKKKKQKLQTLLLETDSVNSPSNNDLKNTLHNLKKQRKEAHSFPTLKEQMSDQLKSSRFRWLNEQLYTSDSAFAAKYFKDEPEAFEAYHTGYRKQVSQWPLNPLEWIINSIKSSPSGTIIADMGCGEARLAEALPQFKVHSFDLVTIKSGVVACDMAHTPLLMGSVDIVVFCLSLMGTNLNDFLLEANRVLKIGGTLKVAEVESRFEDVDNFTSELQQFGFQLKKKDFSHQLFYFMDFKKIRNVSKTGKLPVVKLEPCLYKKR